MADAMATCVARQQAHCAAFPCMNSQRIFEAKDGICRHGTGSLIVYGCRQPAMRPFEIRMLKLLALERFTLRNGYNKNNRND